MADICQGCSLKITPTQTRVSVKCNTCDNKFHGHCVNITVNDLNYLKEKNQEWLCPPCSKSRKHSRSDSPFRPSSCDEVQCGKILNDLSKIENDNAMLSNQFSKLQLSQDSITKILERIENAQESFKQNFIDLESTQNAHFQCLENDIRSVSSTLAAVNSKLDSHAELLQSHSREIGELKNCVRGIEERNRSLNSDVCSLKDQIHAGGNLSYTEIRERIFREKNVIIFGLPETENCSDRDYVDGIIGSLPNSERQLNFQNVSYSRIGMRRSGRPLKIQLPSRAEALHILRHKNVIVAKFSQFKVSIKGDCTPTQLEHLKLMRTQLSERFNAGEQGLTIKYVKGEPTIVNTNTTTNPKN